MAQPNYNFQKAERDRAKAAKKEAKLKEKQERKAQEAASPGTAEDAPADASFPTTAD